MPSAWEDLDEDPAVFAMVRRVHDMSDLEFCEFCQMVCHACECGQETIDGVPSGEAYRLAVSDAEFRHKLRGVEFPI